MEVMIRHNPIGNFFGWISYTYRPRSIRRTPRGSRKRTPNHRERMAPIRVRPDPHLGRSCGIRPPQGLGRLRTVPYVTGIHPPFENGVYDIDSDAYSTQTTGGLSDRMPPFYALDLRVDKTYTFKRWWLRPTSTS